MLTPDHLSSQKRSHLALSPEVLLNFIFFLSSAQSLLTLLVRLPRKVKRMQLCLPCQLKTNAKSTIGFFLKLLFKTQILLFIRNWHIISNSSYQRKRGKKRSMTIQTENTGVLPFLWPKKKNHFRNWFSFILLREKETKLLRWNQKCSFSLRAVCVGGTSVLIAQGKDRQRLFTAVQNDHYLASTATNEDIRWWGFFLFFFKAARRASADEAGGCLFGCLFSDVTDAST